MRRNVVTVLTWAAIGSAIVLGILVGWLSGRREAEPYYNPSDQDLVAAAFREEAADSGRGPQTETEESYAVGVTLPDRTCIQIDMKGSHIGLGSVYCFDRQTRALISRHHFDEMGN